MFEKKMLYIKKFGACQFIPPN